VSIKFLKKAERKQKDGWMSNKFLKKAERKQKDGYKHRTEYKPNLGIWR